MGNDRLIVSVSCGPFSCIIEGFDDPYATLRAIAAYLEARNQDIGGHEAAETAPDPQAIVLIAEKQLGERIESVFKENTLHIEPYGHRAERAKSASSAWKNLPVPVTRLMDDAERKMSKQDTTHPHISIRQIKAAMGRILPRGEENSLSEEAAKQEIYKKDLARVIKKRVNEGRPPASQSKSHAPRPQDIREGRGPRSAK
ncbi:hypothetical protein [Celeribacter litoreus]|uniref:hypothetical protein n=1 Tax=Celeribacter litoreus TaxID=2876714 RepID=UPI001CCCD120|nr:hypothetical protein [Celeribacter litoreus]MCA0045186.1 hypothetical protein [Celeribacter litoreus]